MIHELIINVSGITKSFNGVSNLVQSEKSHLEFDYIKEGNYHFSGTGSIISKIVRMDD